MNGSIQQGATTDGRVHKSEIQHMEGILQIVWGLPCRALKASIQQRLRHPLPLSRHPSRGIIKAMRPIKRVQSPRCLLCFCHDSPALLLNTDASKPLSVRNIGVLKGYSSSCASQSCRVAQMMLLKKLTANCNNPLSCVQEPCPVWYGHGLFEQS